ncbi:FAD-dependent oxidoreductase [Tropicibacter naphthalenivorans]|uniref:NADH:ubiquinone reductase (non-electrogenic) n=1 Tax=Tropicibacter naphthalenivorans TaxID=441103 RepID=A0A0P1GKE6_9RHOB|nr:FAD-dependent oxidoreductase [Tropicibacter naphthalenivorans]CUH82516.1 NADH dehydrogenase-like protein [Tropicibacter naphthalenivorans]SMD06819.1 NADH dehydrogenase [Tropicibacter naphthalenivorans]
MKQKLLVLGGGFGGLYAARELRKRFGDSADIQLISEENYFVFQPLLPEVAAGAITEMHAVTSLRELLKKVRLRKATIHSVDFARKVVTVFQGVQRRPTEIAYDHLVVAMGSRIDLSRVPGLEEHALKMKTLEDARRLRAHIIERLEHADVTQLPEVKREALTFVVVGAGFSGIETIGEVKELIDRSLKYYPNIDPSEVRVIAVEFAPRALNELPESLAAYAVRQLKKRGVELMFNTGVASVTGRRLVTSTGETIPTRTIIATIGNAPSPVVLDMGLELTQGRVAVDRFMRAKGHDNVWSLGDCALIPMKENATERNDFAPPTAQFAVREAAQLASNIAATVKGKALKPFQYKSRGALASLGARRGVAEVFGVKLSGYVAWLLWRAYYLSFMPGFDTKLRVFMNWMLDGLRPRSVVALQVPNAQAARYVHYAAGDPVFERGNRSDGFYTVVSGQFEVSYYDEGQGKDITHEVGPGGHFGERMIMGESTRYGTVKAVTDGVVLVLGREEFTKLSSTFDALGSYLEDHLSRVYHVDWHAKKVTEVESSLPKAS